MREYLRDKKNPLVLKTDETTWKPPSLYEDPPPFNQPPISQQFFHDHPSLSKFQKQETPLNFKGDYD